MTTKKNSKRQINRVDALLEAQPVRTFSKATMTPEQVEKWSNEEPSDKQKALLWNLGFSDNDVLQMSRMEASDAIEHALGSPIRPAVQERLMTKWGYEYEQIKDLTGDEALQLIRRLRERIAQKKAPART